MEQIYNVINSLICFFEVYLIVDFFRGFFSIREKFNRRYTETLVILVTGITVRIINSLNSSSINLISMQIVYSAILFILFNGSILKKIFIYLVMNIIMIGCEFLWIVMMSHSSEFYIYQMQESQMGVMLSLLGLKLMAFFLFNLIKRLAKKDYYRMNIQTLILYCIVPVATIGIMVALAYLNVDFADSRFLQNLLIGSAALMVVGNVLIFYVFDNYTSSMEKIYKQEITIARLELEEKRYTQIEAVNQSHSRFLHDIRHYMKIIGAFAAENKSSEIMEILPELQIRLSNAAMEIFCSNQLLNTILNEKKNESQKNEVDFKVIIEPDFCIEQIEKTDLIVIMGNLLENAIEAASKCEDGFVKAFLFTQNDGHFVVIKIINNYIGEIEVKEEKLITRKEEKEIHGFGVQNVRSVVDKYGGNFQCYFEKGRFTAVVVLPNTLHER